MNIWLAEVWRAWLVSLRRPGFLLLATGVLALGIGGSIAGSVLADSVLQRSLPFAHPQHLVMLLRSKGSYHSSGMSPRQYLHMHKLTGVTEMGLYLSPWQERQLVDVNAAGKPVLRTRPGSARACCEHSTCMWHWAVASMCTNTRRTVRRRC